MCEWGPFYTARSAVSGLHHTYIISMFVTKITRCYRNRQYVNKDWFCLLHQVYLKKSERQISAGGCSGLLPPCGGIYFLFTSLILDMPDWDIFQLMVPPLNSTHQSAGNRSNDPDYYMKWQERGRKFCVDRNFVVLVSYLPNWPLLA